MKQHSENDIVICTRSYNGIPYLHSTENGVLYRSECGRKGRFIKAAKLTVTANGWSKRIKIFGKVYYFSELRKRAFKEKTVINLKRKYCDDSLPF